MECRLEDRDAVVLEHVEQRRLAGIVEAQEQQLGVLVEQAERRQEVGDCVCVERWALVGGHRQLIGRPLG